MVARVPWFWDWSPAAWAAIAAWATFGVALAAAWYARHQVSEARKTREEQAQPFVIVDFRPSEAWSGLMDLVIANVGQTLARNVHVVFDPPLQSTLEKQESPLREARILREGIPTLPPKRDHVILFERMPDLYDSALPRSYDATVSFEDSRGRSYKLQYVLDLDVYFGTSSVEIYGAHHTAKALREIEKTLRKWTQHSNGIRVWVRNEDAYLERQREEFERWREEQRDGGEHD